MNGAAEHMLVDRVLAVCGGLRVAVAGTRAAAIVRELRRRGVASTTFTLDTLPAVSSVDLLWIDDVLRGVLADERAVWAQRLLALAPRALLAQVASGREPWTTTFLAHGWRQHPQYQSLAGYAALERDDNTLVLLEPLPTDVTLARTIADLRATRDLHMDMLREVGRRADAHVARYDWARRFVRPGDRVLDAACGLGYGSALLADATLAESITGIDADDWAIRYAQQHYGSSRTRLSFAIRDVTTLETYAAGSFDLIVSFETLEHLPDPERFVEACQRLLTPGGRFLCSVPNAWVDDAGRDPNPHHLHVFDRARLDTLCRPWFAIEHIYGQTAGGGMKLGERPRAIWDAEHSTTDAEWWLLVGLSDALATSPHRPSTCHWTVAPDAAHHDLLAFNRDYAHPWLVRAMVSIGQRTTSPLVLRALAARVRATAPAGSADEGAALCVLAYRALDDDDDIAPLMSAIDRYRARRAANPHVHRWHISLRYVQGLLWLAAGDLVRATTAFEQCASCDALAFNPLIATKTVAACTWLGWLAIQNGDRERARDSWRRGVAHAERALHRPWSELMVDRDHPVLFGLREAADVVELASQCATGLHLLPHAAERPGILAAQLRGSPRQPPAAPASIAQGADGPGRGPTWRVDHVRRVVIFGTGAAAQLALSLVRSAAWDVSYLVDNDHRRWDTLVYGHAVRAPRALEARDHDLVIVASTVGKFAIFAQLEQLGLSHGSHFVHFLDAIIANGVRIMLEPR